MPFDLVAIAAKVSVWSGKGVTIAAAATRLYNAYRKLSPTAKASIVADEQAVAASWAAMDKAFIAYEAANPLSKATAGFAAIDTIARLAPIVGRIAKDGQTLFGADWPILQPDVALILSTLEGTP